MNYREGPFKNSFDEISKISEIFMDASEIYACRQYRKRRRQS